MVQYKVSIAYKYKKYGASSFCSNIIGLIRSNYDRVHAISILTCALFCTSSVACFVRGDGSKNEQRTGEEIDTINSKEE